MFSHGDIHPVLPEENQVTLSNETPIEESNFGWLDEPWVDQTLNELTESLDGESQPAKEIVKNPPENTLKSLCETIKRNVNTYAIKYSFAKTRQKLNDLKTQIDETFCALDQIKHDEHKLRKEIPKILNKYIRGAIIVLNEYKIGKDNRSAIRWYVSNEETTEEQKFNAIVTLLKLRCSARAIAKLLQSEDLNFLATYDNKRLEVTALKNLTSIINLLEKKEPIIDSLNINKKKEAINDSLNINGLRKRVAENQLESVIKKHCTVNTTQETLNQLEDKKNNADKATFIYSLSQDRATLIALAKNKPDDLRCYLDTSSEQAKCWMIKSLFASGCSPEIFYQTVTDQDIEFLRRYRQSSPREANEIADVVRNSPFKKAKLQFFGIQDANPSNPVSTFFEGKFYISKPDFNPVTPGAPQSSPLTTFSFLNSNFLQCSEEIDEVGLEETLDGRHNEEDLTPKNIW